MAQLVITVNIDPGDSPEVRARLRNRKGYVGAGIPAAVRAAIMEAMWVAWPTERYGGDPDTYREPTVGRIHVRYNGPRDTYEGK